MASVKWARLIDVAGCDSWKKIDVVITLQRC